MLRSSSHHARSVLVSCVPVVQTLRYGYRAGSPKAFSGSLDIRNISRDSIFRLRMTSGTQSGIMPRSSAQVSMLVVEISIGSLRKADSRQNPLCLL